MTAVVELAGVSKGFSDPAGMHPVLVDIHMHLDVGEIVALVGRSGSGKTTLLTLVAGLEAPDIGTVRLLDGEAAQTHHPWTTLAILPQSLGLLGELTVAENIALPLRLAAVPGAWRVEELMERLGLHRLADRYPNEVSLGEQQRTAMARAAIVRPRVLIADEPVSHQNDAFAADMMALVVDLASTGTAFLLATHDEPAVGVAHRVLRLDAGRLEDERRR